MTLKYGRKPPHPRTSHPRVVLDAHTDWDALLASVPAKVDRATAVLTAALAGKPLKPAANARPRRSA